MHIDVSHILASEEGARTSFKITGERPQFSDITMTEPVEGELHLTRTDFGLASGGQLRTSLQLDCHRCLGTFSYPTELSLKSQFATSPEPEQWPILAAHSIDLAPLIHQELVLATPIKQLCRAECLGLCIVCGQRQETPHEHPSQQIEHRPRITINKHLTNNQ